jgi:hypothetical protein
MAKVLLALALAGSVADAFAPRFATQRVNRVGAKRMAIAGEDEVRKTTPKCTCHF